MVDRLTTEYEGTVEIRQMNVEKDESAAQLAADFRVQYVPTFVLLNADGTTSDIIVGKVTEDRLRGALDALR